MAPTVDTFIELQSHADTINYNFNITGNIHFKKLFGGICNTPIYAYQLIDGKEAPIGVFKAEIESIVFANSRFKMIELMTADGFKFNPKIFKNKDGNYLTKIGEQYYSLIEYIQPDPVDNTKLNFTELLSLTQRFHAHSQKLGECPDFHLSRYQQHMARQMIIDDIGQFDLPTELFKSKAWQRILPIYHYFCRQEVKEIFDLLPKQVIIGDNQQANLIFHKGEAYYIDLDARRYDLRLYDLTSIIRNGNDQIRNDYLSLTKNGKLFDLIDKEYAINVAPLDANEKKHFHFVLLFAYIEFFSWALNRIKSYLLEDNMQAMTELLAVTKKHANSVIQMLDEKIVDEATFSPQNKFSFIDCLSQLFCGKRKNSNAKTAPIEDQPINPYDR